MAYVAIISARHKMERLYRSLQSNNLTHDQIGPRQRKLATRIYRKLRLLEEPLRDYADMDGQKLRFDPLEQQVEDVADKLDDVIESYLANPTNDHLISPPSLSQIVRQISSLIIRLRNSKKRYSNMEGEEDEQEGPTDASTTYEFFERKVQLIGLKYEERKLLSKVLQKSKKLIIISIYGMVGIGKTTLVRQIYDSSSVKDHFHHRFWVTVGPNYELQEFMQVLLDQIICSNNVKRPDVMTRSNFRKYFKELLKGKRYLIVLDDIWSLRAFKDFEDFFPIKGNSRIITTTRLRNLAYELSSREYVIRKGFLYDEQSWALLREMAFTPEEHISYELQKFGKKIAKNCEGLPLTILAVGQHLSVAEKTTEYWKEVSETDNIHDIIKDEYENISETILRSYTALSRRLKECFLYIGILPKYEISADKLVKLWVAEGFDARLENLDVESEARDNLNELFDHCVVLQPEYSSLGHKAKTCRIHYVFRYLCLSEAKNEKFCLVVKKYADTFLEGIELFKRISIHNNVVLGIKEAQDNLESIPSVRSLLCLGPRHRHILRLRLNFRLLKILNMLSIRFYEFPLQVLKLVRLRYLAITYDGDVPASIAQLWNLAVLIVGRHRTVISPHARACLPMEIWKLHWLRHLQCTGMDLPDPSANDDHNRGILEQLVTLLDIGTRTCSQGVLARVPNLLKLGVRIELAHEEGENFSFLDDVFTQLSKLETFKCVVSGLKSQTVIPSCGQFPKTLRKLTLSGCRFPWSYMTTIGNLPVLEALKLRCSAFCGPVWETNDDQFARLEVLLLEDLDIKQWITKSSHFPKIYKITVRHCYKLRTISSEIKESGFGIITFDDCRLSLTCSVTKSWKNPSISIDINSSWWDRKKE